MIPEGRLQFGPLTGPLTGCRVDQMPFKELEPEAPDLSQVDEALAAIYEQLRHGCRNEPIAGRDTATPEAVSGSDHPRLFTPWLTTMAVKICQAWIRTRCSTCCRMTWCNCTDSLSCSSDVTKAYLCNGDAAESKRLTQPTRIWTTAGPSGTAA